MQLEENGYYDLPPGKIAAVVTYLEMTERPSARPAPEIPRLSLRRVEAPDLAWYRDLFRRIGTDWLWFGRLVMPEAELLATIRHPLVEVYALSRDGRDEGLLELDRRRAPDVELAYFGLTPALVGTGAGRWLMNRAIELAWCADTRRLFVHTCSLDHPAALAFYIRSGFRPYKRAIEVADDPRLLGLLPESAAPWLPLIGGR
ncbi:GNAT family N-acetyltransferase [Benzoatithermus flavus]|uniref:GNAT family N-acetyltransferase n=1 Tax=Benzoatithermus flavus TaxID=3108223 RepID=A0ABU8XLY3_9PROT